MSTQNNNMHCLIQQTDAASILTPVLIIEFILGLPGNAMALWVFCFSLKTWKPLTVYLLNLVLADFLLIISLPFRIDNFMRKEHWIFGGGFCRINLFMLTVNRSASIGFMTLVAIDRYFKIVLPHHRLSHLSIRYSAGISFIMWALVLALRCPLLSNNLLYMSGNMSLCRSFSHNSNLTSEMKLHYGVYIFEFFIPFGILLFCTFRITWILKFRQLDKSNKVQKAIKVLILILLFFTICFMPGILSGLITLLIKKFFPENCKAYNAFATFFSISIAFTYLNSVLDPIIYCFSSSLFLNTLKKSINSLGLCHLALDRKSSYVSDSDRNTS
ncbi:hydroxycarboxylic acid receptor 2-like [Erpetoichthys calabaricus]|uniref:hydroxycarboxylic acid receptor 2-like n=1 Tax=Erpetoichthys calabaricus TaxID=27687 RepID=UPI00109F86D6|nr:hydroxycarboxylic acid receptor 2-like [Erpetoichthys calabaricus]